jgi:hypothetical protein
MVEADSGRLIAESPARWLAQVHLLQAHAVALRFDQELQTRYQSTFHILHFKIRVVCVTKVPLGRLFGGSSLYYYLFFL